MTKAETSNKQVMSIAIRPEIKEELTKVSRRKGLSNSSYIQDLVEQALKVNPDDDLMVVGKPAGEEVKPIILMVPVALRQDPDNLQRWLNVQMAGIHKAMCKKKEDPPVTSA